MKMQVSLVLALALVASVLAAGDYVYVDNSGDLPGPSQWGTLSPVCANGRFQSPINIVSSFVPYVANYGSLSYSYTKDSQIIITETGNSVVLTSTGFADNFISVNNVLNGSYVLDNVVFHWGQTDNQGSEHQIDFEPRTGEIQYVHYSTRYSSLASAISSGAYDAVAIVSTFLEVGKHSPKNLTALINAFNVSAGPLSTSLLGPIDWTTLIPKNRQYFTYTGSFSAPGCDEVVQWFVFNNPITISRNDLARLRKVPLRTSSTTFSVGSNLRPTQTLGGRKVTSNFIPNNGASSSASTLVASFALVGMALIAALF